MRTPFQSLRSHRPVPAGMPPIANDADLPPTILIQANADDEKRTVRARRRRRSGPPQGERQRADAPQRRRPRTGGSSGGGGTGFGGGLPLPGGGRSPLFLILLVVAMLVCGVPASFLFGGDDGGADVAPAVVEDTSGNVQRPTATPRPTLAPAAGTAGQTWTVMLYQDADDKVLERDILLDFNEAERVGSTDAVNIVAQLDRYRGGYAGDGDWYGTRRYYVTRDGDLERIGSPEVDVVREANMADGAALVDFVAWAVANYPADRYVLIMSDHGAGWPGGWSDPDPGGSGDPSIPLSAALGNQLYLNELDDALAEIRRVTGIQQFELIGMDACLMGHLEVFSALAPHARFAVASQETEPALGWAYTGFLEELVANPDMNGANLGQLIVDSYIDEDQRIVDDQARAEFARQGSPLGSLFGVLGGGPSAAQVAQQLGRNVTLTAVDLAAIPALLEEVNGLSTALQSTDQRAVAQARSYAQSFTSIFGSNVPPSYIDLGHFAQLVARESGDGAVARAADGVLGALRQTVIAEKHGPNKPGATGVSLYFPNSQLYANPVTGPQSYTVVAGRFAAASLWDDFLAFHYTGRSFSDDAVELVVPDSGAAVRGPGAGQIDATPLLVSGDSAAPGEPILLSTDISGENVGYVHLFTGFYDAVANAIFVADRDYLESDVIRELEGVYYPDWGDGDFTLEFEWEPLVFAINDGVNSVVALFQPRTFGAAFAEATYTVDGNYIYADNGESRHARLYFQDGLLRQVFGFTGENGTGAPREIIPEPGDRFTVLEQWLDLDAQGRVAETAVQEGGTLTFGSEMFFWEELDAAPGEYVVGFVIEDLDGNATEVYAQVTVR